MLPTWPHLVPQCYHLAISSSSKTLHALSCLGKNSMDFYIFVNAQICICVATWVPFWTLMVPFWFNLWSSWGLLDPSCVHLEPTWSHLETPVLISGPSWASLVLSLASLGLMWAYLEQQFGHPGTFWTTWELFWHHPEAVLMPSGGSELNSGILLQHQVPILTETRQNWPKPASIHAI